MSRSRLLLFLFLIGLLVTSYYLYRSSKSAEPAYLHQKKVEESNIFIFHSVEGPVTNSIIPKSVRASWQEYQDDNNVSALAILLTDSSSNWLGLVHGLKNVGVPFVITNLASEAVRHSTVLVYPVISGKVLSKQDLQLLAAIPRNGGTLIGVNVLGGGLNEVCGFDSVKASNRRTTIRSTPYLITIANLLSSEPTVRLTNPDNFTDVFPTNGYTNATRPLFIYAEDSSALMTYKDYGKGKAFAIGLDLGTYFLRYMNARGFNAYTKYANQYEPGMDVLLRMLKQIYVNSSQTAITIGTVPYNKALTLLITHDIDYTKSIENAVTYAQMEQRMGIKATYFIQTKYIKDWNDNIFFNDKNLGFLLQVKKAGMEIGSHSVSHSRLFSKIPLGTGKEMYPAYRPFVQNETEVFNASILGELRVSKFLLETLLSGTVVRSFRPGHLEHPFALPEALLATEYRYSSSVTANNVQTHFPYMSMYNRGFDCQANIVELPITVEDEMGVPILNRLDSAILLAEKIGQYGGLMNVLIHTDITGQKLEFEKKLITALKEKAWTSTVSDFGGWWATRNDLIIKVNEKDGFQVAVTNASDDAIQGVSLQLPSGWKILAEAEAYQEGHNAIIKMLKAHSTKILRFKK